MHKKLQNKKFTKFLHLCLCLCTFCTIFLSCTTIVDADTLRPAEIDIKQATTITIVPFMTINEMRDFEEDLSMEADYLHKIDTFTSANVDAKEEISCAKVITTLFEEEFDKLRTLNRIPTTQAEHANLILYGGLTYLGTHVKSENRTNKTKQGTDAKEIWYWREVSVRFKYYVFDTSNYTVLEEKSLSYALKSDETYISTMIPTISDTIASKLYDAIHGIVKQFEPSVANRSIELLFHKHTAMKTASTYAQNKRLKEAYEQYMAIYQKYGFFEASYNAGIILEALGDLAGAKRHLTILHNETQNKRQREQVLKALDVIQKEIDLATKLQGQSH